MPESERAGCAPNFGASMERVIALIDGERSAICDYAEALVNDVRQQMARKRAVLPVSERGHLNVRAVISQTVSVSIHWYRVRSYSGNAKVKGNFSLPVTRGRGVSYPVSSFAKDQPWEREMARDLEAKAAVIRQTMAELVDLQKKAKACKRRGEEALALLEKGVS